MAKLSFDTERTFDYSVSFPNGEQIEFTLRMPTAAEIWNLEDEMDNHPHPTLVDIKPRPGGRSNEYVQVWNDNDPAYIERVNEWNVELSFRRIALCLVDEIPGQTIAEKSKALRSLSYYETQALRTAVRDVIFVSQENIRREPFLRDAGDNHGAAGSQELDEGAV